MNNMVDITLRRLRASQNVLKNKFYGHPRVFNEDEWQELLDAYRAADLTANAADVERRIEGYKDILRSEHTPLTAEAADAQPWQLKVE